MVETDQRVCWSVPSIAFYGWQTPTPSPTGVPSESSQVAKPTVLSSHPDGAPVAVEQARMQIPPLPSSAQEVFAGHRYAAPTTLPH